jgi:DNA (cytosine-5)-methyltransferase 1
MKPKVRLKTVNEVADVFQMTPQNVRKMVKSNKIRATRYGKQWLIDSADIIEFNKEKSINMPLPKDHCRLSKSTPKIIALSFFSGAMGLDIGMKNGGIEPLLACENNKYCRMTIEKNNPDIALIGDINKYSAKEILELAKIPKNRKVDIIFGGPPCQAFSTAGARRALDDARGNVFLRYIDIIEDIKPKYIVIENVRGLLSAPYPYKDIKEPIKGGALCIILDRLHEIGYTVSFELYNAANFGAPQIRERVVIIGKLGKEKVDYLTPTNSEGGGFGLPEWRTFSDAVKNLKNVKHHFIQFPEKRLKYFRMLEDGQCWKDIPEKYLKEAMGAKLNLAGGKTGFYRRVNSKRPSPTLVTSPIMPATDLCHPTEDRPLSVEEYKNIQEFPSNWEITGPVLEQYRQIGNAVPIKLGEAIAKTIIADMNGKKLDKIDGFEYSRYKNTNDITWQLDMDKKILEYKQL